VRIGLNNLKTDFYISDKERSKRSAAVKEDELRKDGKNVENDGKYFD